jgi:hypothetical protein
MQHRPLRHAIALSLGVLIACAGTVAADTARADGDVATTIIDSVADLRAVAPGEVLSVDIGLVLTCTGSTHVDPGQTVTASIDSATAPLGGAILSVTDATVGPAPADWPAEGATCPVPAPIYSSGTPSVVTLRAPTTPGVDYRYSLMYHRSISPFGVNDPDAVRQATVIDIVLDVVVNTPPSLVLPAVAAGGSVEANTTGGWTADWSGLGATDAEDDPDPTATCDPAPGTLLGLVPNTVTCGVTDAGGLAASDSFVVTVVDTTAPTLTGVPESRQVTTGDPAGTTIDYTMPGATDVADPAPDVACLPASGSQIGLRTTTVNCTATDASGNRSDASFDVTVDYVAPHVASATWAEPVAGSGSTFSANRGRTVPVKVELSVDGEPKSTGAASLIVTPCGGGSALTIAMTFGGGRWSANLDTTSLAGSCHTVAAVIDGLQAGAFQLELRGAEPAKAGNAKDTASTDVQPTTTDAKPDKTTDPKPTETNNGKR